MENIYEKGFKVGTWMRNMEEERREGVHRRNVQDECR
jgi:hypothetical protein